MNNLQTLLSKKSDVPLLMTHFIVGFPTIEKSVESARALIRGGASILEVQIPFSDPVADGPAIVEACHTALKSRVTVHDALTLIETISKESNTPIVIMSYANPIYQYGITQFIVDAKKAGMSGIIIPDLPFDTVEGKELVSACRDNDVHPIAVVSPGVSRKRLEAIAPSASGFVYCTSRRGITGANSMFDQGIVSYLKEIREVFNLPLAVGFGIKTREDINALAPLAEVVVAGSVFVEAIKNTQDIESVAKLLLGRDSDQ
jgi:tryptophan synthase alpha chain